MDCFFPQSPGLYFKRQVKCPLSQKGYGAFLLRQLVPSACAISSQKNPLTFLCSLVEEEKTNWVVCKVYQPCCKGHYHVCGHFLWSSSFDQRIPRVYSSRLCSGSNFPAKTKKIFLQSGLGNFTQDLCFKVFVGLPGKRREWSRAHKSRATGLAPCL